MKRLPRPLPSNGRRRIHRVPRRSAATLALALALTLALAGCGGEANDSGAPASGAKNAKPAGVEIRLSVGNVGMEFELTKEAAEEWAAKTGNRIVLVESPSSATDRLALFQQQLAGRSSSVDLFQIDVVWPGLLGDFLYDLKELVPAETLAEHFPRLVENNTVDGRLVAIPWFADAGLLYCRSDLLERHGFQPPATWGELTKQAAAIQKAERANGNDSFWGFVWQGSPYEGLTCNALEWISASGVAPILDENGEPTVDDPRAIEALALAASWRGTISPPGVTTYMEDDARGIFQAGNAAFMRNWPYAYALGQSEESPTRGKVALVPLPRGDNPDGRGAATLGGWQLAVSRFSKHPELAAQLALHLTSAAAQKERAIRGAFMPTRPALYDDPEVLAAQPYMATMGTALADAVARPSSVSKHAYNRVSSAFWLAVHKVFAGEANASRAMADLAAKLREIRGDGF
jgi:trehalose/maltose transport system substrate-binding protein